MMGALSILWSALSSRLGLAAIVALISWQIATSRADQRCDAAAVRGALAVARADLMAARKAEEMADKQAEGLAYAAEQYRETIDELETKLLQRGDRAVCHLSDADARSLLNIDASER